MNTSLRSAALLFVALHFTVTPDIFAQGSLTPPPGSPAPTMKSLDQIEPRTPVSSLPFTISTGGSYYLTKSLSVTTGNAITITVDNVTVDLNGFTISSSASPASGNAITLSGGRKNVRITNGNISGTITFNGSTFAGAGFTNGIVGTTTDPMTTTVSFVNVSGCMSAGIYLGLGISATLVDACNVENVGGNGIAAVTITNSTAANCGLAAITGHAVTNCRGDCVLNDVGINATVATNCYGRSTNNIGLTALTATGCYGSNLLGSSTTTSIGLNAQNATGCQGASNAGIGLVADTALNCDAVTSSTSNLFALSVKNAENCYGNASAAAFGYGILATGSVKNCYGISGFTGIQAQAAEGCTGLSTAGGFGLQGTTAANCYGGPSGSAAIQVGISATTATNCFGTGGGGIGGSVISDSYGIGTGGDGIGGDVISNSYGTSGTGHGIDTTIAIASLGFPMHATNAYFCGTGSAVYP